MPSDTEPARRPLIYNAPCGFLSMARLSIFLILWLLILRLTFMKGYTVPDFGTQSTTIGFTTLLRPENNPTDLSQRPSSIGHSLTAILPVNHDSLSILEDLLMPLLMPSNDLKEVIIICPEKLVHQTRGALRNAILSSVDHPDIDISLHTFLGTDYQLGVINAVSRVSTDWVLLMDHEGLLQQSNYMAYSLLHPSSVPIPSGPRGVVIAPPDVSRLPSSDGPENVSYLLPPFLLPSFLDTTGLACTGSDVWASLGRRISDSSSNNTGGILIRINDHGIDRSSTLSTGRATLGPQNPPSRDRPLPSDDSDLVRPPSTKSGVFSVFLPTFYDMQLLVPLVCLLRNSGHNVNLVIYDDPDQFSDAVGWEGRTYVSEKCSLLYTVLPGHSKFPPTAHVYSRVLDWLETLDRRPDIAFGPSHENIFDRVLMSKPAALRDATVVRIPQEDFPYCGWMGSLSVTEWRDWGVPRVDISIITNDRPRSLSRLLHSLSNGRYFGDALNIRVHLEQSADMKTMKLVEGFSWAQGNVFIHHRVIHGGLLAAVVESWYPDSNDTYGLLLEDDVELSPLFYAWVKMSLLRYRYGDPNNHSSRMFGISLYQQKNVELPLEGRRAFNARTLFANIGLPHPNTPYLSPVPCSWGAVYFPEHWREFHTYLSFRLSEHTIKTDQIIVPGVRSNRWTKSWKKYFIEMVYLRGYVMLYPNYDGFFSLSTNHLEVGSHVKVRTKEKQDLFILPLMQLPRPVSSPTPSLLDLPFGTLPTWDTLPVLNLTGSITTLDGLANVGALRRTALTGCIHRSTPYNVHDLMCIDSISP